MAIIPIWAATDGLINTSTKPTLEYGVRGLLLTIGDPTPGPDPKPPIYPGGGGDGGFTYKGFKKRGDEMQKFDYLKMEDEEIMIIIKTFMKCQ